MLIGNNCEDRKPNIQECQLLLKPIQVKIIQLMRSKETDAAY